MKGGRRDNIYKSQQTHHVEGTNVGVGRNGTLKKGIFRGNEGVWVKGIFVLAFAWWVGKIFWEDGYIYAWGIPTCSYTFAFSGVGMVLWGRMCFVVGGW